jgi:hypothetical protein
MRVISRRVAWKGSDAPAVRVSVDDAKWEDNDDDSATAAAGGATAFAAVSAVDVGTSARAVIDGSFGDWLRVAEQFYVLLEVDYCRVSHAHTCAFNSPFRTLVVELR